MFLFISINICYSQDEEVDYIDKVFNSFIYSDTSTLWISSLGGWNKYDGINTVHYLSSDSLSGLKGEWIQSGFFPDRDGRMWTCTYDHLCYYKTDGDKFECFQPVLNDSVISKEIRLIGLDASSQQPILRVRDILCYYDIKLNHLIPIHETTKTEVPLFSPISKENRFLGLGGVENTYLEIWGQVEGDWLKRKFDFKYCNKSFFISDGAILDKEIVLATSLGLLLFNQIDYCQSQLINFNNSEYYSYNLVVKDDFIIVSTDKFGVLFFDLKRKKWVENINDKHPIFPLKRKNGAELSDIGTDAVLSFRNVSPQFFKWNALHPLLSLQKQQTTFFKPYMLYENEGYYLVSDGRSEIEIYSGELDSKLSINGVGSLRNFHFYNHSLYFIDESKLWKYDLKKKKLDVLYKHDQNIIQNASFKEDQIVVIIENKAFKILDGALSPLGNNRFNKEIISWKEIDDNASLICTYNEAIYLNEGDTISLLTDSYIYDLTYDVNNKKIFLALGNGLGIFDIETEKYSNIEVNDARVNKIYLKDNSVFLSASKGIYRYVDGEIKRYATKENNVKDLIIVDSFMYYICEDGLRSIHVNQNNSEKTDLLFIEDKNYTRQFNLDQDVYFEYGVSESPLNHNVRTNTYLTNNQGNYSFKVLGRDYEVTQQNFKEPLSLPPLGAGNYKVEINGCDHLSRPLPPLKFGVNIKGPIWMRWWFILGTFLSLLAILLLYLNYRSKQFKRKLFIANEINELEKSALQAQMNPHFIFNCLNSIQNFIMENDKESAMQYLGEFAKLIRLNLKASVEDKITLDEEITILENYLNLERLRLNEKFEFQININNIKSTNDVLLPPMLIQPFVENAVIHGMSSTIENGEININFDLMESTLFVKVQDNGKYKIKNQESNPNRKSYGVSITQKRLDHINKINKSDLQIIHSDKGTEVNFKIEV